MKLVKMCIEVNQQTFAPELVMTIAFPLETAQEPNGLCVLDAEKEYACLISENIVKYIKEFSSSSKN